MVVFTCGHCGESVQKPKVEKHYMTKCRNMNPNLSCMDCFKDFLGQDYEAHIKCVTEEERYSGKGFVSKEKKGEKKQNAWVEMLQDVLEEEKNASSNVLRIIETISKHNNTPRKKPKFINFVKNVCGQKTNHKDIDQAWDLISVKLTALSNANNRNQGKQNTTSTTEEVEPQVNGDKAEEKSEENGVEENGEALNSDEEQNGAGEQNGDVEKVDKKKLTKKQRKEEKKHKKYEAELQSAGAPHSEEVEEEDTENKKGKKKKNKSESISNGDEENQSDGKNKNKKRKRQDTVNSVNGHQETTENVADENKPVETIVPNTGKIQKKKIKMDEDEEADESICLHDQNVAKIGELAVSSDKFNWHAVILSVLEKKGNEVPFKRLQKKVLGEYSEATGREVDDRIADKFIKKLKSAPNVRVDKNRVLLID